MFLTVALVASGAVLAALLLRRVSLFLALLFVVLVALVLYGATAGDHRFYANGRPTRTPPAAQAG